MPSLKLPVAENDLVAPNAMVGVAGVTEIPTRVAVVTSTLVLPVTEFAVALIVVVPADCDVTSPALTVATAVTEELQVAAVKFCVLPLS